MSEVRQILEHRLAKMVQEWSNARAEKAEAMREHNEAIKNLELSIERLLGEIHNERYQPSLPFGPTNNEPPRIQFAEEELIQDHPNPGDDEEGDAAEAMDSAPTPSPGADDPAQEAASCAGEASPDEHAVCTRCEHYETMHNTAEADAARRCLLAHCDCEGYLPEEQEAAPEAEPEAPAENAPEFLCRCGHEENWHQWKNSGSGILSNDCGMCSCERFDSPVRTLVHVPVSDINWQTALKRATQEELALALQHIKTKTGLTQLRRRLRKDFRLEDCCENCGRPAAQHDGPDLICRLASGQGGYQHMPFFQPRSVEESKPKAPAAASGYQQFGLPAEDEEVADATA